MKAKRPLSSSSYLFLISFVVSIFYHSEILAQTCGVANIDNCTGVDCQFRYTMDGSSSNNYQMMSIPFTINLSDLPDSCYTGAGSSIEVSGMDTNGLIYNIPTPTPIFFSVGTQPRNAQAVSTGCDSAGANISNGYQHYVGNSRPSFEIANTACTVVNFNMSNLITLPNAAYGMSNSISAASILYKKWAVAIPPNCRNTPKYDELIAGGTAAAVANQSSKIGPGESVTTYTTKTPTPPQTCTAAAVRATCDPIYSGSGRFVAGSVLGASTTCQNGCVINGALSVPVGTQTYYSSPSPVGTCASVAQNRTCNPGDQTVVFGTMAPAVGNQFLTCVDGCGTIDGVDMPDGATHDFFTVASSIDCTSKKETITCTAGRLSGSARIKNCIPTPPPAQDCGVVYRVGATVQTEDHTIPAGGTWRPLPTYSIINYGGSQINGLDLQCPICATGDTTSASCPAITNGSSSKSCRGDGMSWNACNSSCNAGFVQTGAQPNISCNPPPPVFSGVACSLFDGVSQPPIPITTGGTRSTDITIPTTGEYSIPISYLADWDDRPLSRCLSLTARVIKVSNSTILATANFPTAAQAASSQCRTGGADSLIGTDALIFTANAGDVVRVQLPYRFSTNAPTNMASVSTSYASSRSGYCPSAAPALCWSMYAANRIDYDPDQCDARIVGACPTLGVGGGAGKKCAERSSGNFEFVYNSMVVHSECRPVSEGRCNGGNYVPPAPSCWQANCGGSMTKYFPTGSFTDQMDCQSQGNGDYCVGNNPVSCQYLINNAACVAAEASCTIGGGSFNTPFSWAFFSWNSGTPAGTAIASVHNAGGTPYYGTTSQSAPTCATPSTPRTIVSGGSLALTSTATNWTGTMNVSCSNGVATVSSANCNAAGGRTCGTESNSTPSYTSPTGSGLCSDGLAPDIGVSQDTSTSPMFTDHWTCGSNSCSRPRITWRKASPSVTRYSILSQMLYNDCTSVSIFPNTARGIFGPSTCYATSSGNEGLLIYQANGTAAGGCGTAANVQTPTAPNSNLCSSGTPTTVYDWNPWRWACGGGGNPVECFAPKGPATSACNTQTVSISSSIVTTWGGSAGSYYCIDPADNGQACTFTNPTNAAETCDGSISHIPQDSVGWACRGGSSYTDCFCQTDTFCTGN